MGSSPGFGEACAGILSFLLYKEKGTSRVLITPPDNKFAHGLKACIYRIVREDVANHLDIQSFLTHGTKRDRVTCKGIQRRMDGFKDGRGPRLRVACVTEEEDSVTGMDLHNVNALVCIGSGRTPRRLGRIVRVSRILREKRDVVRCFYLTST